MCEFFKRMKIFLNKLANDQILLCKPSDMIKFDLETPLRLGKSIFDHWWKADKTSTNRFLDTIKMTNIKNVFILLWYLLGICIFVLKLN